MPKRVFVQSLQPYFYQHLRCGLQTMFLDPFWSGFLLHHVFKIFLFFFLIFTFFKIPISFIFPRRMHMHLSIFYVLNISPNVKLFPLWKITVRYNNGNISAEVVCFFFLIKEKVLCPWHRNKMVQNCIKNLSFSDKFFIFSDYFPIQLN